MKRIQYSNDRVDSLGPIGLIVEGERTNLVPEMLFESSNCVVDFDRARFCGYGVYWKFPEFAIPIVEFDYSEKGTVTIQIKNELRELGFTFSSYLYTVENEEALYQISLSDGFETVAQNCWVTGQATRFAVSHEFATLASEFFLRIKRLDCKEDAPSVRKIGIALPVLENGLFASTPIIPSTAASTRGAELVTHDQFHALVGKTIGTVAMCVYPSWHGHQLGFNRKAYLIDCIANDSSDRFSLFADGAENGCLRLESRVGEKTCVLRSGFTPPKDRPSVIAFRFAGTTMDFIIGGHTTASHSDFSISEKLLSTNTPFYLGSSKAEPRHGLFGVISFLVGYPLWLADSKLRAEYYIKAPHWFPEFESDCLWVHDHPLAHLTEDSWALPIIQKVMGLHRSWQEMPPPWLAQEAIDEGDFRDEMRRYLSWLDYDCIAEYTSVTGRTDLLVRQKPDLDHTIRFEFKVWGRNDYKEMPAKPLKYMLEGEHIGVVIMINPSKVKNIAEEYRTHVETSATSVQTLIERPFEKDFAPDHFVSVHATDWEHTIEVLHIVFNKFPPAVAMLEKGE